MSYRERWFSESPITSPITESHGRGLPRSDDFESYNEDLHDAE